MVTPPSLIWTILQSISKDPNSNIHEQYGAQTHWDQIVREITIHRTNSTKIHAKGYEIEFHVHLRQYDLMEFPLCIGSKKYAY